MAPRTPMAPFLALALVFVVGASGQASERLRITNGCAREPIWIAHMAANTIGPDAQNVEIPPLATRSFATSDGLTATRYWPKMGCSAEGSKCALGGSGGPGEACVKKTGKHRYRDCAPPVDTKFEATFGISGLPCDPSKGQMKGCDYADMSLVDGWTLPFKLIIKGECTGGYGTGPPPVIDCSRLSFEACPKAEHLPSAGMTANLQATNPKIGKLAGCYSPCQRLVSKQWNNTYQKPQDAGAAPYCCPTPPESPEACRSGPMKDTAFLKAVHERCPGVYGYAYDDGMGLLRCESSSVYELTFYCPDTHFGVSTTGLTTSTRPATTTPTTSTTPATSTTPTTSTTPSTSTRTTTPKSTSTSPITSISTSATTTTTTTSTDAWWKVTFVRALLQGDPDADREKLGHDHSSRGKPSNLAILQLQYLGVVLAFATGCLVVIGLSSHIGRSAAPAAQGTSALARPLQPRPMVTTAANYSAMEGGLSGGLEGHYVQSDAAEE
mmetsp:Transcript_75343/g.161410  ORF Transcript_75343/g.161410 Transcript_75343/m.161410 type:complete len:496 (+) Transcript_75343:70-1557(+)